MSVRKVHTAKRQCDQRRKLGVRRLEKKIDLMHKMFGVGLPSDTCKTCWHLKAHCHNNKTYYKCACYGETPSAASDFRQKWQACGLYNKPYILGRTVMEINRHRYHGTKKEVMQIEGQVSMFAERD